MSLAPYFEAGGISLYHADCLDHLDVWGGASVMVSDPPYGMALRSGWGGAFGDLEVANDSTPAVRDAALAGWGERPALVFGRWSVPRPAGTRMVLTWAKGAHTGMGDLSTPWKPDTEEVYVLGKGFAGHRGSSVLAVNAPAPASGQGRYHPTEKPVQLMRALVTKCPPGVVLDPFAGSGSTLVACAELGRRAIGFEIEERYCQTAAERVAYALAKGTGLFPIGEAA